jgi:hypothetical protein
MAQGLIIKVKNNSGSTISSGKAVYITGLDEDTQAPTIDLASSDDNSKLPAMGVTPDSIDNGSSGSVRLSGILSGFDTSSAEINTSVYVGTDGNIIFEDPSSEEGSNSIAQEIGVVATVEESGQILLFPMELRRTQLHAEIHAPGGVDEFLHASQHASGGGDELSHSDLAGVTANQHHPQLHASSHASGNADELSHSDLAGVTANQHHSQLHASSHAPSSSDDISGSYLPRDGSVGMTGSLGVGTDSPDSSAALEISSTTKGFLLSPMTAAQASAITPTDGLMVYVNSTDTTFTSVGFWGYENGAWVKL